MKDFTIRFFSGFIGLLLLIFIVLQGGYLLGISIYIVALIGLREFYQAIEKNSIKPMFLLGYISTTILFLNFVFLQDYLGLIFSLISIISLISLLINKKNKLESIAMTILGIMYIPFLLFHIIYLENTIYIWLVFIIAFGTDTFAYITGNLFGKKKLCPNISPNKTIAGSIGGVLGSMILTIIFAVYFELDHVYKLAIISIIASAMAQLGDLTASKIKRTTGIKDYGFIIPGHGGVLDRFDSIIFTVPIVYYYISIFLI